MNLLLIGSSFPIGGWLSGLHSGNHSAFAFDSIGGVLDCSRQTMWAGDSWWGRSRFSSSPCSTDSPICWGNLCPDTRHWISRSKNRWETSYFEEFEEVPIHTLTFIYFWIFFWDRVYIDIPGAPETHSVDQDDLELTEICLSLKCWD